jgi:hypothetical protein
MADSFAAKLEQRGREIGLPLAEFHDALAETQGRGKGRAELERTHGKRHYLALRKALDQIYEEHPGLHPRDARKAIRNNVLAKSVPRRENISPEEQDERDRGDTLRVLARMHRGVPVLAAKLRDKLHALGDKPPRDPLSPHSDRFHEVLHALAAEGKAELTCGPQGGLRVSPKMEGAS